MADRERMQVSNGMRGWVSEVEGRVEGQTTWDEAVKNLAVKYDPAWAHKNVGQFFHDMLGLERAFVLDAANRPIYAMDFGRDAPPKAYAKVSAVAAPPAGDTRHSGPPDPPPQLPSTMSP